MNIEHLIEQGNTARSVGDPELALRCYAEAFALDRNSASAFNNYGNVLRECGDPAGAVPFLQRSIQLAPSHPTAQFNLAVAWLLQGDYAQGWPQYETRWNYEHLAGTLPAWSQPRWTGQDLENKTILVIGEQGHGDNIQFIRFVGDLTTRGAQVIVSINPSLVPLFRPITAIAHVITDGDAWPEFDYWIPIMSIPAVIGSTLENLSSVQYYLTAPADLAAAWQVRLGAKRRLRVGFSWSGRRDTWINGHKAVPFATMLALIQRNPDYEWINLQIDCDSDQEAELVAAGVTCYPGAIATFADTAGLMQHLDVIISVDTAITHLAGALGRPVWVMLSAYALDWRWLLGRDSSPWYSTARLFRQDRMGDWTGVMDRIHKYLSWYKV